MDKIKDVIIVGGGAAGFFSAINIASINPKLNILILERGSEGLQKVKISGGGRCNVTHAEFIPSELVLNYPRGEKELLGPFHQFMTGDTIQWFEDRGIVLKTENDGRMFPESNNSQTIIDCFLSEVKKLNIDILYNSSVKEINLNNNQWIVSTDKNKYSAKKLLISTGSNIKIWNIIKSLDHSIINPVPSLFSFNIKDERIDSIPGVTIKSNISFVLDISEAGQITPSTPQSFASLNSLFTSSLTELLIALLVNALLTPRICRVLPLVFDASIKASLVEAI